MRTLTKQELQDKLDELETERDDLDEKLAEERDSFEEAMAEDDHDAMFNPHTSMHTLEKDIADLQEEIDEIQSTIDEYFRYEETAIAEHYFTEYAQELAESIYNMPYSWPFACIDWGRAANDLKLDYRGFEYDGTEWLIRR
jgi:chromosome segregation ATPase